MGQKPSQSPRRGGTATRSISIGGELDGLDLSGDRKTLFDAGHREDKIAVVALATGAVIFAPLSPEPCQLTRISGTGTFYVSPRTEPKVWIIDEVTLTAVGDFLIEGEGHQMVAFR